MILIAVKFTVRPGLRDSFFSQIEPFVNHTRDEPGNIFFEWAETVDVPDQFVLLEGFESPAAGEAHVNSDHFKAALEWFPALFTEAPQIIHVDAPGDGWSQMAEF